MRYKVPINNRTAPGKNIIPSVRAFFIGRNYKWERIS
jgi:hypothetical protein